MKPTLVSLLVLASLTALSGCGKGTRVIHDLKLNASTQDQHLLVELEAKLMQADFTLPSVVLPLIDPKRPERRLGELETRGNYVFVRVDATEAARFPLADGSKLPNGTSIPVNLNGMTPIGIPVDGTNSMVYLAANDQQLMLGAAITIRKDDSAKTPFNVFLPIQINNEISGTGGMYFGEKQGIGVFAVRTKPSGASTIGIASLAKSSAPRRLMSVSEEAVTNSKLRRMDAAIGDLRGVVQLD